MRVRLKNNIGMKSASAVETSRCLRFDPFLHPSKSKLNLWLDPI